MRKKPKGSLMIIGGGDKRSEALSIFEEIVRQVAPTKQPLLLITVATYSPDGAADEYVQIFKDLGFERVELLDIRTREEAYDQGNVQRCDRIGGVFFTGGDQLRITSQVGDSPLYRCLQDHYLDGALIVGTSAGAAAMPNTMIISGPSDESNRVSALSMAPGLGLIEDVVIDSHFAERGRMGRLLGAVAQNPRNLGLGIDESTAVLVERGEHFRVLGDGAVYVVDGTEIAYSSLSEDRAEGVVSIFNAKVHVLGTDDCYNLKRRQPVAPQEHMAK
jgi:cyanophycinase